MKLSLPDSLTLSRIAMAGVMLALLETPIPFAHSGALVVFILAGLTDFLDGYLARNRYGVTSFGQLMDPLADKIVIAAAFISFAGMRLPTQATSLVPGWIVVVIVSREFLVTGLRLLAAGHGTVISAGKWGKHKTAWQIFAAIAVLMGLAVRYDILRGAEAETLAKFDILFDYVALAIGLGVAMITVASGAIYFSQHKALIGRRRDG